METAAAIQEFVSECWERVLAEVRDAAVYIDHAAAESLHWYSAGKGYLFLKDAGARTVQELAMYNFRYVRVKGCKKAVIISTSDDVAFYQRTMKMIFAKNNFEICKILCGATPRHTDESGIEHEFQSNGRLDRLDYTRLKEHVKDWMNCEKLSREPFVGISFVPLSIAGISKDLLVTPPFADMIPELSPNSTKMQLMLKQVDALAHSFRILFEHVNVREEVYTVGRLSELVAESLERLAVDADRRRSMTGPPPTGISFILIDRTLDLCTPTSSDTECFLTKIFCTLPRMPHHCNDVAIDVSRLFDHRLENIDERRAPAVGIPGCLASNDPGILDLLISVQPKKLLLLAYQTLNDMLTSKESPRPKATARITAHSLQKLVDKLREGNRSAILHSSMKRIEAILAVIAASTSGKGTELELLTSLEKLALQNLSVAGEFSTILVQVSNIIRTRRTRGLTTENLLALLLHLYALAGSQVQFTSDHEALLEKSIAEAINEDLSSLKQTLQSGDRSTTAIQSSYQRFLLLLGVNDDGIADEALRNASQKAAAHIVGILRAVATQRSAMLDYRSLMIKASTPREPTRRAGLLEQLITDILRTDGHVELRDLHQSAPSLVSAGFNLLLRGRTKPHPRDHPLILIYVIGGIAPEEVRIVRELEAKFATQSRLIISGTRLLSPNDVVDKFLLCTLNTP